MRWESLDPERVERAIQALLRKLYPGLRSFDGAGGDGGRDAQLVSDDEHTVFEIKSFGRLTGSRRKQVERSLRRAVDSTPAMTRWVLVIPMNMTPTRPSVKSAEEAWFTGRLQAIAPDVDLDWWGQDWLDGHFADRPDLQRLVEGPQSQLLALASEHGMEQAALSAGAPDLHARLRALRSRADSLSPYWTLGFSVSNGVVTSSLEAKVPEAAEVDPITVTSTFRFRRGDEDDERLQQEFERTLNFGGEVDLPAGHLTDFVVEASPETSLLFDSTTGPEASSVSLRSERVAIEPHVRCRFDIIGDEGEVLSRLTVWFRERTVGARGIMLYGCDAAGILKVELGLPRPERVPAAGETMTMGGVDLRLHLPDTVVGLDVESLHPVFTTLAAARPGTSMRFDLPGLGQAGGPVHEPPFERAEEFGEVVSDLRRLEMELGVVLQFPAATVGQFDELRRVIRCIDGETVEHDGGLVLGVRPGMVQPFLEKYDEVMTEEGGLFSVSGNRTLTLGSTEVDIGPVAFWAPRPRLANRPELEAASALESASDEIDAVLEPQGVPFRWLSREFATSYLEQSG